MASGVDNKPRICKNMGAVLAVDVGLVLDCTDMVALTLSTAADGENSAAGEHQDKCVVIITLWTR
jgi:hypothetical protein